MIDMTYNQDEIQANPEWQLAFSLSEILNDNAPLGWGKYIFAAKVLLSNYDITKKPPNQSLKRNHDDDLEQMPLHPDNATGA